MSSNIDIFVKLIYFKIHPEKYYSKNKQMSLCSDKIASNNLQLADIAPELLQKLAFREKELDNTITNETQETLS